MPFWGLLPRLHAPIQHCSIGKNANVPYHVIDTLGAGIPFIPQMCKAKSARYGHYGGKLAARYRKSGDFGQDSENTTGRIGRLVTRRTGNARHVLYRKRERIAHFATEDTKPVLRVLPCSPWLFEKVQLL